MVVVKWLNSDDLPKCTDKLTSCSARPQSIQTGGQSSRLIRHVCLFDQVALEIFHLKPVASSQVVKLLLLLALLLLLLLLFDKTKW
jgi:hypothetical protein